MKFAKVLIVPFADTHTVTGSGGGTSWEYFELDALSSLRYAGPWLSSLRVHLKVKAITANTEVKTVFYWSLDGNDWTGPLDLHSAVSATGSSIQAAYTTATSFGIQMRYAIGLRASSGTSAPSVTLSGYLVAVTQD